MPSSESHRLAHVRKPCVAMPEQLLSPPYDFRDEMSWIDFSGTENPLGTPQSFIDAIADAARNKLIACAPDYEAHTLRSALARTLGLSVDHFLVGSTVPAMLRAVVQSFEPRRVGLSIPCPAPLALEIANAGHTLQKIASPAGFMTPDAESLALQGASIDAAVLANPSYPTSRLLSKPTLVSYLETCEWVVVDERSIELTLGGESMVSLVDDYPNLIVIQSFSEQYALAGTPISYCVAQPGTIAQIAQFYDNSCVSMLAELLAEPSLEEHGKLEHVRDFLESEIPWLQCMLSLIPGITIFPAEANYVMCSFSASPGMRLGVRTAEELGAKLQLAGFLVHKLSRTPGLADDGYFCVAVRTREDNEKLIAAMRKIILPD